MANSDSDPTEALVGWGLVVGATGWIVGCAYEFVVTQETHLVVGLVMALFTLQTGLWYLFNRFDGGPAGIIFRWYCDKRLRSDEEYERIRQREVDHLRGDLDSPSQAAALTR